MREAEHRAEEICVRDRGVVGDEVVRPRHPGDQSLQGRLDGEDHPGAAVDEHRHVPAELDGVAKSLFGHDQDRPAGEVLAAVPPESGGAIEDAGVRGDVPPGLVRRPPFGKAFLAQVGQAEEGACFGVGRIFGDECFKVSQAPHPIAGDVAQPRASIEGVTVAGVERQGNGEVGFGVGEAPGLGMRPAPVLLSVCPRRVDGECTVQTGQGPYRLPGTHGDDGVVPEGAEVIGIDGQGAFVSGQCLVEAVEK